MDIPSVKINNAYMGVLAAIASAHAPVRRVREAWLGLAVGIWIAVSTLFHAFVDGSGYIWNNLASGVLIFTSGLLIHSGLPVKRDARNRKRTILKRDQYEIDGTTETTQTGIGAN
jgi:hypothetical protein